MEEAHGRIEAGGFQGGLDVMAQEGVEEREQGVDVVERRPAAALAKEEGVLLLDDEAVEASK
jgi:hypothetical protein